MRPSLFQNTTSRLSSVDALRGFALLGVLVTHFLTAMSGYPSLLTEEQLAALPTPQIDQFIDKVNQLLVNDKFRALFSFLFGLSFFFQLNKAERLGISFQTSFIRRLMVLLLFGLIHAYLLWWGDILRWYFFAGLILLFCYRLNNRIILSMGVLLAFVVPTVDSVLELFITQSPKVFISASAAREGFLSESYLKMLQTNLLWDLNMTLNPWYRISHTANILGYFFLGLWAGKANIFKKVQVYREQFFIVLIISFCAFLLGTLIYLKNPIDKTADLVLYSIISAISWRMNIIGLFLFYVCGFVMLFHFTKAKHYLHLFVPVGQMTLTNYIMQAIVGVLIFNGIGLGMMGSLGPSLTLPLAIIFFALQIGFSYLWLTYFSMGPLEWLWRVLISGKIYPLLKSKTQTVNSVYSKSFK